MFRNTLKIAWRHVKRHKGYAFINVFGLAVSIACCVLMFLWVLDEITYDRFYPDAERIYRIGYYAVVQGNTMHGVQACPTMAPALNDEFPEVEVAMKFRKLGFPVIRYGDKVFSEERWCAGDSLFFDVLSVPVIAGDPKAAMRQPNAVVINQSTARKYFGDEDPIGKTLNADKRRDWIIMGVVKDIPHNSHFHFDFMASMISYRGMGEEPTWLSNNYYTYFKLREGVDWKTFEEKLQEEEIRYVEPQVMEMFGATMEQMQQAGGAYYHFLQPLTWIHLHSHLEHELEPNGDMMYVYIFSIAALGILILAVVNFVNLSTARSANRAREVGIRKTVGSTRSILIRQFLMESILYAVFSALLAVLMVEMALPAFQQLTGKWLSIPYGNALTILLMLVFILIVGFASGLYPAFFLSTFHPVSVLKDDMRITRRPWTRSALVVFQFSVAIVLLVSMFAVRGQVAYIQQQKLDAGEERILIIHKTDDLGREIRPFKQEIIKHPGVLAASNSDVLVGGQVGDDLYRIAGRPESDKRVVHHLFADADYARVYNLKIQEGVFYHEESSTERGGIVLNMSAVRSLGVEDPVGQILDRDSRMLPVFGVVEDFRYRSLHHTIAPLIIQVTGREAWGGREMSVRIASEDIHGTIVALESTWKQFTGNQAFEYEFFDDYYNGMYRAELRTGSVFVVFSVFAFFIAGLGLLGLSAFIAEQRTKEIGVRKVLGASSGSILVMLTKQFVRWVLVSSLFAWPAAYFIMSRWLQNFAYRDSMQPWIFLFSSVIALIMAVLTVNYQSMKAAKLDPVESLRYE